MSERKRGLNQDELEVHSVLSPGSNTTVSVEEMPQSTQAPKASKSLSAQQISEFKDMFQSMGNFMKKVTSSGILDALDSEDDENENEEIDENNQNDENYDTDENNVDEYDTDEDEPQNVQNSQIKFGLLVNEPVSGVEASTTKDAPPLPVTIQTDSNNNTVTVPLDHSYSLKNTSVGTAAPPVISSVAAPSVAHLPDAGLPSSSVRPPLNWHPDPEVLAWAVETLDLCEWSKEDRTKFENNYSTSSDLDHLFTAVANPPDLLGAIRSPDLLARDYLFKRADTEQFLYNANKDLACGFRPLLSLLSSLKGKGMEDIRIPLAHVFQSMSSAINNISKGRRELGRRFVPLDSAPALFRNKPSHNCLFGSGSLEEAMSKAVEAKKINKDLVHVPRKIKFRNSGQGRQLGRWYKYNPRYNNYNYNNNNNNRQNFRGRGGWKKTRRGTGKGPRSTKASTNNNNNNNTNNSK